MTEPTTKSTLFARCDHVDHHLFAVQPDIPLLDALEHAAVYLSCAEDLALQAPNATRPEYTASLRWASSDARHGTLTGPGFHRRPARRSSAR
ncbi:DUF3077 domain-containing protein [Pseudomonas silesiensis]